MNVMVSKASFSMNGQAARSPEMVASELLKAKRFEDAATERRIELEREIIELLGIRDEGSMTHKIGDGFKVVITAKKSRKMDWDMLDAIPLSKLPESLRPVKVKRELDERGVKYLRDNEPELYAVLSPALTVTPTKPQVIVTSDE